MRQNIGSIRAIPVENLLLDLKNPRYDRHTSQREAIAAIAIDQGTKLANLADDILEKGLNPTELTIATPSDDGKSYYVLEGNRRIAAIKLLLSGSLASSIGLPENLAKRYRAANEQARKTIPKRIPCAVLSREDASHWIYIRHTGENEGVGIVPWDGIQTHRFRGSSPAFQAVEMVTQTDCLDQETLKKVPKISITNIERVLGTPEARKHLGVDVKGGRLIILGKESEVLSRLARIVSDVAHKRIKVGQIESKQDRIDYAQDVAAKPLLKRKTSNAVDGSSSSKTSHAAEKATRVPPERNTVIPRTVHLAINQPRLNKIYHDLLNLRTDKFINSCAVMFRVFLELSIDDFADRNHLSLKKPTKAKLPSNMQLRDMSLREKIECIVEFLEKNSSCTKAELRGVRTLINNRNHVLSVDSLNAYVHNKDYSPTPSDIKTTWDNLQVFMGRLWA